MQDVGFVGLGNVGLPAALNLVRGGFAVTGYDVRPSEALQAAGGAVAASLAGLAGCGVIVQSLPNAAALEQTVDGLLPWLHRGQVIADISSYPLDVKRAQAARVADTGAVMLDCEVSGLPQHVADRTAVLFTSGDEATVGRCGTVLDAMFGRRFHLGPFGAATKMKLIANFMVCAHNLIAAEALNLGRASGLDPEQMLQVLKPSAAGSATFANKAPLMLSRDWAAGRGPFRHMFGYLDRALELAEAHGAGDQVPVLEQVRAVYAVARSQDRHDQDIAAIIEVVEGLGGRMAAA